MSYHTINMFLKFGQEEHIWDLYQNGTVYMNSIQRFRLIEDEGLRGDIYEGVSQIRNYLPGQFEIPEINFKGQHLGIHLRNAYQEVVGNIYSLYCISSNTIGNPLEFQIDKRNAEFGSHCLMIKNNPEFLKRIEIALELSGLKFRHGFVEYYDKNKINSEITLFQKPSEFEYQKEFRIYVERPSIEPFILNIGSLTTISKVFTSAEIVNGLGFTLKI